MNWRRAKRILLTLFLLIDTFLLVVLLQSNASSTKISKDIIQKTSDILCDRNIHISAEKIPHQRKKNQNIVMSNYFEQPEVVAVNILGKDFETIAEDAEQHSYHFENEQGELYIKDNSFTYSSKEMPILYSLNVDINMEFAMNFLEKELEKKGFQKQDIHLQKIEETNGLLSCEVVPLYKKEKIYGVSMYITADREKIILMSGNWFTPAEIEIYEQEDLIDITTILIDLANRNTGYKITEITNVESAFYASQDYLGSKKISAVPIYVLTDQNQSQHFFDARSGTYIVH